MKTVLIIFIVVLCFTCWLADSGTPPKPQGMAVSDVSQTPYGVVHEESMIPDFVFTDKARSVPFITTIEDNNKRHPAEFPMGLR